jgi:hypothetical protein
VHWIHEFQYSSQAVMNTIMNVWYSQNMEYLLTSYASVSISGRILLHRVT